MEINQNQTNIFPVGSKTSGFSALQKVDHNQTKENVVELAKAQRLVEVKQEKKEVETETNAEVEAEKLSSAIHLINERVQNLQRDLIFSVDEDTGKDVVTILDAKSSKVIKQIPSEEMLVLAKNLREQLDDSDDEAKLANLFSSIA